jgi:hypothetical protein
LNYQLDFAGGKMAIAKIMQKLVAGQETLSEEETQLLVMGCEERDVCTATEAEHRCENRWKKKAKPTTSLWVDIQ